MRKRYGELPLVGKVLIWIGTFIALWVVIFFVQRATLEVAEVGMIDIGDETGEILFGGIA